MINEGVSIFAYIIPLINMPIILACCHEEWALVLDDRTMLNVLLASLFYLRRTTRLRIQVYNGVHGTRSVSIVSTFSEKVFYTVCVLTGYFVRTQWC